MSRIRRFKPGTSMIVAALVFGLAASGGAAAATRFVLSSPRQISPTVMRAIAAEAFAHATEAHSAVTTALPGTRKVALAECARGQVAVAGGYSIEGPHNNAEILPTPQLGSAFVEVDEPGLRSGWAVEINNSAGTQAVTFLVHARCVP